MTHTKAMRLGCLVAATLLPFGAGNLAASGAPPIVLADLEATWVSAPGLKWVETNRSVFGVALQQVEITPGHPPEAHGLLVFSDGHRRSWRAVTAVEGSGDSVRLTVGPWEKRSPGPKESVRCRARVDRDQSGRLASITFLDRSLHEAMVGLRLFRIDRSLAAHLNRILLAGTYVDTNGARWEFSEGQQARWPDRRFPYDVAVDTTEADCSYISTPDRSQPGGEQRWGYRWDGDTLALYTVVYDSKEAPIHCVAKPFVQLRRVPDAALP